MANEDLLGAISAAVDTADASNAAAPVSAPEPETDETDTGTAGESGSDSQSAGSDGGTDGGDSSGDDESGEGEGDASAEGTEGDGKGKKPAEGAPEVKLGPDGKPVAPETPSKDEKPDPVKLRHDFVNGPIDQRLKEGTRNRIQFLANEVKRQDEALNHANTLFDAVESTGMKPEELATMLSYARARHHGSAEDKKSAYSFLKGELRALALELGETDTVDFLAEHADLQAAVEANQITAEYAKEVALARSRGAHSTQQATQTAEQQEAQRVYTAGVHSLTTLGHQLQTRDGAAVYAARKAIATQVLKPLMQSMHPSEWAGAFQRAYDAVPKPAAAPVVPPSTTPPAQKQQPQRPSTPAGGTGKKEIKSLYDAVSSAVDGSED